ncbi:plasmid replication protein, CyRepA1 family [Leptospira borgpetersenii]|uniref:plasmid replication protein, CyRepA1 family n=1 Tax=Leptospira borgpetersenii TaxID=174 RepID=UPI000ACB85F3|nr:plasmid replication protein, CyRepA1 family [Leptospira borgpetersenii]
MEEQQNLNENISSEISNPIRIESGLPENGLENPVTSNVNPANNEQEITPDIELFKKTKSALKVIPDDYLKENLFKIVCNLTSTFSHHEILKLLGSRLSYREKGNVHFIMKKERYGDLSTIFKIATNLGWSPDQVSKGNSKPNRISVPTHVQKGSGTLITLNQRYLSDAISVFGQLRKVNVIQSLQGTGKTELFLKLFPDEKIIYACPLKELVRQACERYRRAGIEIKSYEEFKNGELSNYDGNIAVCINSIHKINPANYKGAIVLFDEADQISYQLHSEIMKDQRSSVLKTFQALVQICRLVMFSSADIPASFQYFITDYLGVKEYNHYFNEFNPFEGRTLITYSDKNTLEANIESAVSNGKVCIAGLTKSTLIQLEENLKRKFPEKKILLLMEENKFDDEQRKILTNPNHIQELDVFLYTPIMASGVDISIEHGDKVFLIADANKTLNHFQGFQMANRLRHFKELHFFGMISKAGSYTELYREKDLVIAENRKRLTEMEANSHFGEDGGSSRSVNFSPLEIHSMLVRSENEASRNGLREHFIQHCLERRFQFLAAQKLEFDVSATQRKNLQNSSQNELTIQGVLSARDLSISEAIEIKSSGTGALEKRLELERYRLQKIISFFPGDPGSLRDLKKMARKPGSLILKHSQLKEYFIFALDSFVLEMLENEINKSGSETSKDPIQMRGKIYKEIFENFPRHLLRKDFQVIDLFNFARHLYQQRDIIARYLSVHIDEGNKTKPVETLRKILSRFGIRLTTKYKIGSEYFRINASDLTLLIRSYRRWEDDKKNFFLKKHMFLS